MEKEVVIIVGAGVAGLMAAKELAGQYKVIVLEASDIAGGRIVTIVNSQFLHPVEAGAEFIHGNTPLTLSLLKEAGLESHPVGGDMMHLSNGKWVEQDEMIVGWGDVMDRMKALKEDMSIADFLQQYFADDKYAAVRRSIQKFAEGFDLADTNKASVFALRDEWEHEDEEQKRVKGGYGLLARYLLQQCEKGNCSIHTSSVVQHIRWKKNEVHVTAADGKTFWGNKIIITVPLGILQADDDQRGAIRFEPAIDDYKQAARQMGFGTVIKIMLQFEEAFWNKKKKNIGFVISDQLVPTWWTQAPADWPLLTGWLGGASAQALIQESDEVILSHALQSLSAIFNMPLPQLQRLLTVSHIANWSHAPFSLGAYSYNTLHSAKSVALLNQPIEHTIFFAGEALYSGPYPGTVEAALATGVLVSDKVASGK